MNLICELTVTLGSFAKLTGASGIFNMLAPVAEFDGYESPLTFVAIILAKTGAPHARLNGACVKSMFGITHFLAVTIAALDPSQRLGL